jgi:putative spermidine/putrescine transport system substrate-binding protein
MSLVCRRSFISGLAGATVIAPFQGVLAQQRPTLTAVEWGGQTLESIQAIQRFQSVADVKWQLHAGGAAAIIAKISAAKPAVNYDVVAAWSPVFVTMIKQDWLETVTVEDVPNLADIPPSLIIRDAAGAAKTIPREINPHMWGYRPDITPFKITRLQDLLDKRLKGKIVFPGPVLNTCTQMISIARALGGSEAQLEPAWDFVKQLAKSGNIGRVASSDSDVNNSLTSGETSIGFGAASHFVRIADAGIPVEPLSKMPPDSGFKAAIAMQGWCILKGGNTQLAKAWANAMIAPEPNAAHAAKGGVVPTNIKSAVPPRIAAIRYSEAELAAHAFTPDWALVSDMLPEWTKRWERDIAPLL